MNDTPPRGGGKLGPYYLRRRYRNTGSELGRLYEAHNVETGAPALVIRPRRGASWPLLGAWTVRAQGGEAPSFLALEVEQAPGAAPMALHGLTLQFIQLSGALAAVEDREDAQAFLTQQPRPPPSKSERARTWWLPAGAGALAASLVLAAVMLWPRPPPPTIAETTPSPGGSQTAQEEPVFWSTQRNPILPIIGYPLPAKPFKEQGTPPCLQGEVEINGGCWVTLEKRAPCNWGTAEHEGKCYLPIRKKPPEPTSVQP